jgi:hypothetical protein
VLAIVKEPANKAKIEVLKKQAAEQPDNAIMVMMQLMPAATEMMGPVMKKYGFNSDGLMKFLNALMEPDDEEVQRKAKELRALVIPTSMLPMVESMFGGGSKRRREL